MYEHLRNDFMMEISSVADPVLVDRILSILDKIAENYSITERETSLAVIDDETTRLIKIYLSSKKLEGLSDQTIKMYANRLRIFFDMVGRKPEEIEANEIRLFLFRYQQSKGISDRTLDKFRQILNASATLALQNGMEITQVQKMLGHANVSTTQIYAETSQDDVAISHKKYVI